MNDITLGARLRADAKQLTKSSAQRATTYSADEAWRAVLDVFQHRMHMDAAARISAEVRPQDEFNMEQYERAFQRLVDGEPIAYVLGEAWFLGRKFTVNSDVLIPREDTETLVNVGLHAIENVHAPRILDVGTGSGCIAISIALARIDAQVVAVDLCERALRTARVNAERLSARNVACQLSDGYSAIRDHRFDLIVSNPPYVAQNDPHLRALRFEPLKALTAGADGLALLRRLIAEAPCRLKSRATLAVEHGYDQSEAVMHLFETIHFIDIERHRDAGGNWRVVSGRTVAAP